MYIELYEQSAALTSFVITTTSYYIFTINNNYYVLFIVTAGATSLVTRLYRIQKKEYIMNHPIVYADIGCAILACGSYIYDPFTLIIYYPLVFAFVLMVVAAIMSWNLFYVNLVQESFIFQLSGHIIISSSLLYYTIYIL